jgi:hypothetical protein
MKHILFIIGILLMGVQLRAGLLDSLYVGVAGGYERFGKFKGEAYLQAQTRFFHKESELRLGLSNHSYRLTFNRVEDLDAASFGVFADFAVYPFNFSKNMFLGLRWEFINFNWLSGESKDKIFVNTREYATSLYTGMCLYLQVGYRFKLSEYFAVKTWLQPGWQSFSLTNGSSSFGSFVNANSGTLVKEEQNKFACNINLAIEFRVK